MGTGAAQPSLESGNPFTWPSRGRREDSVWLLKCEPRHSFTSWTWCFRKLLLLWSPVAITTCGALCLSPWNLEAGLRACSEIFHRKNFDWSFTKNLLKAAFSSCSLIVWHHESRVFHGRISAESLCVVGEWNWKKKKTKPNKQTKNPEKQNKPKNDSLVRAAVSLLILMD